jgi:2-polyprenyl-6-methoxyphenol hydroxylase-like FAD-dependent oxidoreductase
MPAISNALIIGGGIGGLVAARALRQRGITVDLVEKEPNWTVYGVGIIQPNNFLRALDSVGLAQPCLDLGAPFEGWRVHDAQGNVLLDPPGERGAARHLPPNNGITRPKLHEVLIKGATEVGVNIRLGTTATEFHDDGDGVDAKFSDGTTQRYDLIISFDGAFSEMRQTLFGDTLAPQFGGQGVWRYNFPRPADMDTGMIFSGPDTKIGLVPLSPTLMYMFVVTPERDGTWYSGPDLANVMRSRIKGYGGLIAELREQITDPAGVVYRPMINLLVADPWYKGRIVLAGDAAHTTTPHLAQGAAMAVEDAVLLGELLGSDGDVQSALQEFMRRRFSRVKYVVDCSTQIATWEKEEWAGLANHEAQAGALLHEATSTLMAEY